jgi:Zincin-like metallopeptidase
VRGPLWLPGPLSPQAAQLRPTRRDQFDEIVLFEVDRLTGRVGNALGSVEFGTEDVPHLTDDWTAPVPLGSLVPARQSTTSRPGTSARIVLFRRPIEMRAKTPAERSLLVHAQLVEHVAAYLGCDPADLDES